MEIYNCGVERVGGSEGGERKFLCQDVIYWVEECIGVSEFLEFMRLINFLDFRQRVCGNRMINKCGLAEEQNSSGWESIR